MSARALALRYGLFAALATVANLLTQRAVLGLPSSEAALLVAIAAGTLVGLAIKYLLDKRWIFHDGSTGLEAHGRRFGLYAATGVATTALFWGSEYLFWLTWESDAAREAGAVLGLAVGYAAKYRLDRRYVFADARPAGTAGR